MQGDQTEESPIAVRSLQVLFKEQQRYAYNMMKPALSDRPGLAKVLSRVLLFQVPQLLLRTS